MRFGWRLTQAQRKSLGLPRKDGKKFYRVPGYKVYFNLLSKLNPDTLAESLSAWLRAQQGALPASLALDRKMIRETVDIVWVSVWRAAIFSQRSPSPSSCVRIRMDTGTPVSTSTTLRTPMVSRIILPSNAKAAGRLP